LLPNDINGSTISLSLRPLDGLRRHKDAKTGSGVGDSQVAAANAVMARVS
jgi:hypothetical protein